MQRFPTPFVEGFGWDESGELIFPDRPEVWASGNFTPSMSICGLLSTSAVHLWCHAVLSASQTYAVVCNAAG